MRPTRLSNRGIRRIGGEEWTGVEGLGRDGRYRPYRDYVQKETLSGWTIGIGCLVYPGDDYSRGLTLDEVVALFHRRMADVYAAINRYVSYELDQSGFDALCDAGHNLGPGFFNPAKSNPIRALNNGDLGGFSSPSCDGHCVSRGQPAHLQDYNRSEKGFDPGLYARRKREGVWFFEPPPPEDHPLLTEDEQREIARIVGATQFNLTDVARESDDAARDSIPPTERG